MYHFKSRVRYSEVDSEQKLTLSAILNYLQDCCTFQSEELGIGLEFLSKEHVGWILASWQVNILQAPSFGEEIIVTTWPYSVKGFYGLRNFTITGIHGETYVEANSVWVFMDTKRMRPARVLEQVVEAYKKHTHPQLEREWEERKISIEEGGILDTPVTVQRYHIDTNHHVNNEKYIQIAEELLPEDFEIAQVRAEYKKAAVLGNVMYPRVIRGKEKTTVILEDDKEAAYAIVSFLRR